MAECAICGTDKLLKKAQGKSVCNKHYYLFFIKDWKKCPLCDAKADFEPKGIVNHTRLKCKNCSAEWEVEFNLDINPVRPEDIIKNLISHYAIDKNFDKEN